MDSMDPVSIIDRKPEISDLEKYGVVTGWRPPHAESRKESITLIDKIGLFGTAGSSTWRSEFKKLYGAPDDVFFNPQKGLGEWKPEDAKIEAENIAKDKVLAFAITKDTEGYGSLAELGFAALGAMLRGQKVGIFIEESDTFNADAQRARDLVQAILKRFSSQGGVSMFNDLSSLVAWSKAAITEENNPSQIPSVSQTLAPAVLLSGSSGSAKGDPSIVRQEVKKLLGSTPFVDTYIPADKFSKDDVQREADLKQKAAVLVHTISSETESLGALGEVALLAANAYANGQALCVYMEPHESDRKSNANKSRAIVRQSMTELLKQYPGIVYFIEGKQGEITEEERASGIEPRDRALARVVEVAQGQLATFK